MTIDTTAVRGIRNAVCGAQADAIARFRAYEGRRGGQFPVAADLAAPLTGAIRPE
jgi:hypothetical protein